MKKSLIFQKIRNDESFQSQCKMYKSYCFCSLIPNKHSSFRKKNGSTLWLYEIVVSLTAVLFTPTLHPLTDFTQNVFTIMKTNENNF